MMMSTALTDRPDAPTGPPKLTPAQLRAAQAQTLDAPRRRYGVLARALFKATDLVYGPGQGIVKFTMLELEDPPQAPLLPPGEPDNSPRPSTRWKSTRHNQDEKAH
jgi:hypothetical protein